MQTEQPTFRLDDARAPLWFGGDAGWGDAVRTVDPSAAQNAEAMIAAAGLGWTVEQHPLEAVLAHGGEVVRLPVPKVSVAPFRLACLNGMLIALPDAQWTWKAR